MKIHAPFFNWQRAVGVLLTVSMTLSLIVFPQGVSAQVISFPAEINKEFTPISITAGGISRLNITIFNPNLFQIDNAAWLDNLAGVQPGITIANPVNLSNTCGGTVVAPAGGTSLSLTGGTVPPQVGITPGSCTVSIDVTSTTPGNLINTIPEGGLTGTGGGGTITNTTPASATLRVGAVQPPTISKSFNPNTILVGQISQLTITIRNRDSNTALTQTTLTDNLPQNVVLANPIGATLTNCGVSASVDGISGTGSLTLNNGTIPAGGTCTIRVNVTSNVEGSYTNTIPAGAIRTRQGVTNGNPATATLNVQGVRLSKAFNPPNFAAGGTTTLTITIQNPLNFPLTNTSLNPTITDTLPAPLTVVNGSATTTCAGGTAVTVPPNTVQLMGGTIPAANNTTPGTCTISVQVSAPIGTTPAQYTNTIPAQTLITDQDVTNSNPATAQVRVYTPGQGVGVIKTFSPATINPGQNSRLRIVVTAPADKALTNFSLVDPIPAGLVIGTPAPSKSGGCGAGSVLQILTDPVTGALSISLTNGTIAAGATCRIDVYVTGTEAGVYTNTINPGNIQNAQGETIPAPVSANLTIRPTSDLSISKVFTPPIVAPNGISLLTISLMNTNASPLINVSLLDNLPGNTTNGIVVAPVPNAATTCGSGVVTAVPGTQAISLSGGTIPAQVAGVPGLCTITVNVQGKGALRSFTNTIPAANVSGTIQGTTTVINPVNDATARITISGLTIGVVKEFIPLTVFGGSASTMNVQLINPNNADLVGIAFTDNMPAGMIVANPVNPSVGTCGGSISASPTNGFFSFSGGSLPPFGSCTLSLSITMTVNGNLTNTIGAGAVTTTNGASNPQEAKASLTNLPGASVSKSFSPNPINAGDYSLLTITIQNTGNIPLTNMGLRDDLPGVLPAGVSIANTPTPINNCGGSLSADAGTQTIELTGGTLGASSSCTIVVPVTGLTPGSYQNVIPAGRLSTNEGATNTLPATDTLVILNNPLASIGDFVWLDADADGVQDVGEGGISGVTVNLYRPGFGPDGIPGNADDADIVATTTTAANGSYHFTGLTPGDYSVQFVPPTGYSVSPQDQGGNDAADSDANPLTGQTILTTLEAGENDLTWDAGMYQPASLGDRVWNDLNADGVQDAGETGVNGVTVNLYRPGYGPDGIPGNGDDNDVVATTTTDGNGNYLFDNLIPGDYYVDFIPPNGYSVSPQDQGGNDAADSDANPTTGQTIVTTLTSGENDLTWDAGLYQPASLGDLVWNDLNANGVQDAGEAGIDGVTVNLYRPGFGPDGIPGNGDDNDVVATTTTANGGRYLFDNLIPGDYFVDFIPPTGYMVSPQDQGGNDAADSDANPTNGQTIVTTLTAGENDLTWDAGLYQPASLGDLVWNDTNANGIQDAGEAGINGVTVNLYRPGYGPDGIPGNGDDNDIVATTTTDGNGNYLFDNLIPGDYYVDFIPPTGYVLSPQDQGGNDATDSDANPGTGQTIVTTLTAGENDLTWDAGLYQPASLGDLVWNDLDADGVQDAGEAGINGVTVNLYRPGYGPDGIPGNGDDNDVVETTTTAGGGLYLFDNLIPGDYFVDFIPPAGYTLSPQDQGGNDTADSDANPTTGQTITTTLTPGENDLTWDAGLYQPASLGDFVWNDLDADGVQDAGEAGIDGVTVNLYRPGYGPDGIPGNGDDNDIVATTTTANGGLYLFNNLAPGDYFVDFIPPAGYTLSPQDQGGNDAADSDANPATGQTIVTTLVPGENDLTWDAGLYQPASLGDFVWNDVNANGIQDGGETGIDGVTVNLYRPGFGPDGIPGNGDDNDIVATTTTTGGGNYLFDNLIPGDYFVDFIPPAGYVLSPQDQGGNNATDSDANPATGQTVVTTLTPGENDLTWDAGLYQPASLGDFVWNDVNADGVQDAGEAGIDGVTVNLYRPGFGPDGIPGNGDDNDIVATTTTAGGGLYQFDNLIPGDYFVDFIPPLGYGLSPQDQGGNDAADSDANPATGQTAVTTLIPGENDLTWDAGLYQTASLGDFVWNDLDADGVQDVGEAGVSNVTVNLYRPGFGPDGIPGNGDDNDIVATTTTDGNGNYLFTNLIPGDYYVDFLPLAGYTFSPQDQGGDDAVDSDANPANGQTVVTTITAGENDLTWDAGLYQPASLGDFVWDDLDADGVQDIGESGIPNVTVNLYRPGFGPDGIAGNADDNDIVATTTTDGNGNYQFTNLIPGNYYVDFIPPAGYTFSSQDQGGNDSADSDANPTNGQTVVTTLTAGENDITWDAGLYLPASLGDFVWSDTNANGIQDAGESGIPNVTVELYNSAGALLGTTSTDANGAYLFTGLTPGDYYVRFIPPAGYTISPRDQGSNDATDSDANPVNGQTEVTSLTSGETDRTWDAGMIPPQLNGLTKSITGTNLTSTTGTNMAIGEIGTYQVVVTVPPGTYTNATLVDTMVRGLAFVACDSIDAPGLTTSVAGSFTSICANPTVSDAGGGTPADVDRQITYTFGTLTNAGQTDATITVTYRAIVLDIAGNVDGVSLNNSVTWSWTGGSIGPAQTTVTVVEPDLAISKTADVNFVANGSEATFTLTILHTQASNSDAFDAVVTDVLPVGLSYVPNSLDCTVGAQDPDQGCVVDTSNPAQPTIRAQWSVFTRSGGTSQIRFRVVGNASLPAGGVTNTANVEWTSMPGDQTTPQSVTPNIYSTERYYDPNDAVNIYNSSSSLALTPLGAGGGGNPGGGGPRNTVTRAGSFLIPVTGFAPNTITELNSAARPTYNATSVTLEIPSIKVKSPIVGVALKAGNWDVSWLANQVGWLEGTAYPTWDGNSVLTAHVVNADGKPGLFARLDKVRVGDYIFLYQSGYRYTYQIVSNKYVKSDDIKVLKHEEKATLTIITCDSFDEKAGTYLRRTVVRAVLIDVSLEK